MADINKISTYLGRVLIGVALVAFVEDRQNVLAAVEVIEGSEGRIFAKIDQILAMLAAEIEVVLRVQLVRLFDLNKSEVKGNFSWGAQSVNLTQLSKQGKLLIKKSSSPTFYINFKTQPLAQGTACHRNRKLTWIFSAWIEKPSERGFILCSTSTSVSKLVVNTTCHDKRYSNQVISHPS